MGAGQSREGSSKAAPRTVRIEKDEIPEEFKNVGVSREVVDRVLNTSGGSTADVDALKEELWEARKRNEELIDQLRRADDKSPFQTAGGISVEDLEQRRKALNEVIDRVEKQFCSYQRENACEPHEKDMMQCIMNNKNQVLNCLPLLDSYQQCVTGFRKQVLNEASAS